MERLSAALEIHDLHKTYPRGVKALRGVSFSVPEGRITVLLGPNGAGKTTLVRCIAGLLLPDWGRIRLWGRDLTPPFHLARQTIAFVFEEAENVYDYLTVDENLRYFGYLNHRRVETEALVSLLTALNLYDKRFEEVGRLSRGMKQKLALLIAFLKDAPLLILDEPTLGLDLATRDELKRFLPTLVREHGRTLLVSTHDMGLAQAIGDVFVFLKAGQVVWWGDRGRLERHFPTLRRSAAHLPLEDVFYHLMQEREA